MRSESVILQIALLILLYDVASAYWDGENEVVGEGVATTIQNCTPFNI